MLFTTETTVSITYNGVTTTPMRLVMYHKSFELMGLERVAYDLGLDSDALLANMYLLIRSETMGRPRMNMMEFHDTVQRSLYNTVVKICNRPIKGQNSCQALVLCGTLPCVTFSM
jgi:hypothetical protein